MEEFFDLAFFQGLASSMIVAILFSFLIFIVLKPKVKISPYISKLTEGNETYYKFKFVNMSMFNAFETYVTLVVYEDTDPPETVKNKWKNQTVTKLELTRSYWDFIPAKIKLTKDSIYAPHCVRTRNVNNDLESILSTPGNELALTVTLKHGFSGLSKTFEERFRNIDSLGEKEHKFGNYLDLME